MFSRAFVKSGINWLTLIAVLAWGTTALAGGFQIAVEAPPQSDPELKDAALIVRTFGCNQPSDATVTATAEGLVAGRRQSMKVDLLPTTKGVYAINQQWPAEGHWVVAITGLYGGHTSSALVKLGPGGKLEVTNGVKKHKTIRVVGRKLTAEEIDGALQSLANNTTQAELVTEADSESLFSTDGWMLATAGALFSIAGFALIKRRARG